MERIHSNHCRYIICLLLAAILALAGCGDSDDTGSASDAGPADGAVTQDSTGSQDGHGAADGTAPPTDLGGPVPQGNFCSSSVEVIFDPLKASKITPFPNNFWTKEDPSTLTGIRVNFVEGMVPPNHTSYLGFNQLNAQLNDLDGFGTIAGLVFRFTGAVDKSVYGINADDTGSPQSPLVLVDIDKSSPEHGKQRKALLEYHEASGGPYLLIVRPLVPLRPKTTYAAMLRAKVKTSAGDCLAASAEMQKVLLENATGPGYDRLAPDVPNALKILRNLNAISEVADIAALTVFTTQSIHEEMLAIVEDIDAYDSQTGYTITTYQDDGPFGDQGPMVAHMIKGTFKAIRYKGPNGYWTFQNGKPVRQGFNELKFELYLPKETAEVKPPFPVAIFQHGLGGTTEEIKNEGRKLSEIGVATIAIDAPHHGSRGGTLLPGVMAVMNMFGIDVLSAGVFNTVKMKDNFRQGYADLLQLARLATRSQGLDLLPVGSPDGQPEIKASEVLVVGHSLGAILTSGYFALDSRSKIAAMGCGGAGLTDIILYSPDFNVAAGLMKPAGSPAFEVEAMFPFMQTVFERGDPGNFVGALQREPLGAPAPSAPKHIVLQAIIDDKRIPNRVNDAWARATGVPLLAPPLWQVPGIGAPQTMPTKGNGSQGTSAGYFHIDYKDDGKMATHDGVFDELVPRTQWLHWFTTYFETGTPELIDPYKELGMKP